MSNIVIFGGTIEGRKFVEEFVSTNLQLHICVATEYGASLLPEGEHVKIHVGRKNELEMMEFLSQINPDFCFDLTHPYATEVTRNIKSACEKLNIEYKRVQRREEEIIDNVKSQIIEVEDLDAAVDFLAQTTGNILITTGSKELEKFTKIPDYKNRCVARVLSTLSVMEKCNAYGFEGKNLITMQGPFSEELNSSIMKQFDISWIVTKSSGQAGGFQEKCEAAMKNQVGIVVVGRPNLEEDAIGFKEAVHFLKEKYTIENKEERKVYLIGIGPGNPDLLTMEAKKVICNCDLFIGANRILEALEKESFLDTFSSYKREEIITFLNENKQYKKIALLYSGDIGFYSGAKGMRYSLESLGYQVNVISGISSVIYFLNKIGESWEGVKLVSCHGMNDDYHILLEKKERICTLLGKEDAVSQISKMFLENDMEEVLFTVGERLSYPDEKIISGNPRDFIGMHFDSLSVLYIKKDIDK